MSYKTRALRARDPRFRRIYEKLGYYLADLQAEPPANEPAEEEDIADVRAEYEEAVGKRPFYGWDIETLRAKMAEALEG